MVVAGFLRLGRYTRFVSHSVMLGFLTGIAVNIVFGQLPDLTGAPAEGWTTCQGDGRDHPPGPIERPSLLVGLGALAILSGSPGPGSRVVSALSRSPCRRSSSSCGPTAWPRSSDEGPSRGSPAP